MAAVTRLKKDYQKLVKDPIPYAVATPLPSNILEWHYVVSGAPDTPYDGGYYHGKLIFPADFPFRPPSIYMITPSGRFQVDTRLCLSISDFHPDTWNPSWTVSTILMGLVSFMNETSPTLGSLTTSDAEKRFLARRSIEFNLKNKTFCELFPDIVIILNDKAEHQRVAALMINNSSKIKNADNDASQKTKNSRDSFSLTANILMITGVVILALAVRYVIVNAV